MHGSKEEGMQHELQIRKEWGMVCGVSDEDGQDMQHTLQEGVMLRILNYKNGQDMQHTLQEGVVLGILNYEDGQDMQHTS